MILIAFATLYLWAGATTAFALWQFGTIAEALHDTMPSFNGGNSMRNRPGVIALMVAAWPVVLPAWVYMERDGRSND